MNTNNNLHQNKIIQLTTYGMKNIENPITLEFANATIESGIKKINNIKGIYGYNGSGKSAIISSVYLYKNLVCNYNYLLQNDTIEKLKKLINYKTKSFFISLVFMFKENQVVKHIIKIANDELTNTYKIIEEMVSLSNGRTINENYKTIAQRVDNDKLLVSDEKIMDTIKTQSFDQYNSFLYFLLEKIANKVDLELNENYHIMLSLFSNINHIDVYLNDEDKHQNLKIEKNYIYGYFNSLDIIKNIIDQDDSDIYVQDDEIKKEKLNQYLNEIKKLENFIKIFKPNLTKIDLKIAEENNIYHIRKLFCYDNLKIEFEYESSGIKQLVKLFTYFYKCAKGGIVFIDEIDTNLNTVYFKKIVSFFKNYGQGQLIFTSHNVEAMNEMKNQAKSINAIGYDNKIDVWVGKGNKSPVTDYLEGFFVNSPMNVDDFDFVHIFLGK